MATLSERKISKEQVRKWFEYVDGELIWRNHKYKCRNGNILGHTAPNGYKHCIINGRSYENHRLVYIYHNGYIPDGFEIDHKDKIRDNNKISNLRLVTSSQNKYNTNQSAQAKGYYKKTNRFVATISIKGKTKHIGVYDSPFEASRAFNNHRELLMRGL